MVRCLFCDEFRMLVCSLKVRAQIFSMRRGAGRFSLNCWRKERTSKSYKLHCDVVFAVGCLTVNHAVWAFAQIVYLFICVVGVQCQMLPVSYIRFDVFWSPIKHIEWFGWDDLCRNKADSLYHHNQRIISCKSYAGSRIVNAMLQAMLFLIKICCIAG